jgi:two-component system LytT family response regulator
MNTAVVIIDDELDARRVIRKYIERYFPDFKIIGEAGCVGEAVKIIMESKPDILFLDIHLQDGTGFDVLDSLDSHGQEIGIVFTTAYDQHALKAFQYHALDYLLKPVEPELLIKAVQHIQSLKSPAPIKEFISEMMDKHVERKIGIPTNEGFKLLPLDQIIFLEADGSYCKIFLSNGKHLVVSKPMKFFTDRLETVGYFIKPHKSYVVNIRYLEEYIREDGGSLKMVNGLYIPISRQKKDEILDFIQRTLLQ